MIIFFLQKARFRFRKSTEWVIENWKWWL